MAKESRCEIISEMLKTIHEDNISKPIQLIQLAYLEWRNVQEYLDFLLKKGYIIKSNQDPENYKLTGRGESLFKRLEDIAIIPD